jgi:beta-lactam-binding protein with PASTA domain
VQTSARPSRPILFRLALALVLVAAPALLHAQDTAKAPTTTTPTTRVNVPAGTRVTRPPLSAPPTISRPPASEPAPQQAPTQQQLVTVPDLSGRTPDEARRLLASAGLEMGRVAQGTGSGTPGTVIQQQPRAGSAVPPKSAVGVWLAPRTAAVTPPTISRPPIVLPPPIVPPAQQPPAQQPPRPTLVTVPRLAGRTVEDARGVLGQVNLQVAGVAEAAGSGAPGTIIRQSPRAGSSVAPGSGVQLWIVPARVAQQPRDTPVAPLLVRVPNVVGQTVDGARQTLAGSRLALGDQAEAPGAGAPGTVARQQPAAGSAMLPGSRVRVWLVPARQAATPATGQVATRPDPPPARPEPRPPVQATTPPAQEPAVAETPAGAAVDSTPVPDVRRLALPQAQARLAAAGFAVAFDTALADSARWTVYAQQPSPGARLEAGGVVAVLLDAPSAAVAAGPTTQPPLASGLQPSAVSQPEPPAAEPSRMKLWIAAVVLLIILAGVGAQRMRARGRAAPPITGVRVALRADAKPRSTLDGPPLGLPRLKLRLAGGAGKARIAAESPLFRTKGGGG